MHCNTIQGGGTILTQLCSVCMAIYSKISCTVPYPGCAKKDKHLTYIIHYRLDFDLPLNYHILELLCPDLPDPIGGRITITSRTVGSVVTYICDEGYLLNGSPERECLASEMWSNTPPFCSRESTNACSHNIRHLVIQLSVYCMRSIKVASSSGTK